MCVCVNGVSVQRKGEDVHGKKSGVLECISLE